MQQPIRGDVAVVGAEATLDLSVVCPFYNEESILAQAIGTLLDRMDALECEWELIVVDDGSKDGSARIAEEMAARHERLRFLGYRFNRGRGHALRTGIGQARGAVIVTTEIDLSWGEDIVERLFAAMQERPDADVVIASPHLEGGGYRNVPAKRVFISKFGNWVVRSLVANATSMNTGMTRAYRREAIRTLPLDEDRKEFHLEVVLKAQALGLRIHEIPALLEWKDYKHQGQRVERKSSSKINKLVLTHTLFSLFARPMRWSWGASAAAALMSAGFFVAAVVRLSMGLVSVYMLIVSLAFALLATMSFAFGVLAQQGNMIQAEIWRMKQDLAGIRQRRSDWQRGGEGALLRHEPRHDDLQRGVRDAG